MTWVIERLNRDGSVAARTHYQVSNETTTTLTLGRALDNDMVIRSDCPSPFDLATPDQFAMVAERQCAQNRIDNGGWQKTAHEVWADRKSVV